MSQISGDQLSALLLPALIILSAAIVAIVGWLAWTFTHPKEDKPQADADLAPAETDASTPSFLGVRRGSQGRWQVSVEGRPYATLDAIPSSETRAQVTEAIRALATFAGYGRQRTASAARTPTARTPTAQAPVTRTTAASDQRRDAVTSAPAQRGTVPSPIDLTQEIGDIIDEIMARRPDLQKHAVSLQNTPGRGITFAVDGTVYQEIEEIPSPEIQALIRDATKEWERR